MVESPESRSPVLRQALSRFFQCETAVPTRAAEGRRSPKRRSGRRGELERRGFVVERGRNVDGSSVPCLRPNGWTFTGRPGADQLAKHKDRSTGPVQCSVGFGRWPFTPTRSYFFLPGRGTYTDAMFSGPNSTTAIPSGK